MKKKRIGIVTYFYFYNYGTMLQALATQLLFERFDNIEAEVIDYRFGKKTIISFWKLLRIRLCRLLVYIKEWRRVLATQRYAKDKQNRNVYFDQFASKNIKTSNLIYYYDFEIINNPPSYDVYLTGSDQTWSPKIGFSPILFLKFAPPKAIKAAYAPSLGVQSFTQEQSAYIRKELQKYDYLSCRESKGSELLETISGKPVETVLDPTLMVKRSDWLQYATTPQIKGKYILCYFLGERDYYRHYVSQLSKQTRLPVYYIPVNWKDFKKRNMLLWDVGPSEFLGLIANAEYVCTDSFHGTVFSVNFHREVRVFVKHAGNEGGGDNSRIYDILTRLGIENQLITEYKKGSEIKDSRINYSRVDDLLSAERRKSMKYVDTIVQSLQ